MKFRRIAILFRVCNMTMVLLLMAMLGSLPKGSKLHGGIELEVIRLEICTLMLGEWGGVKRI